VTVAAVLLAAKLAAWLVTDSVSLLSTLLDSLLDAAASAVNLLAVHHACNRPTRTIASVTARPSRWPGGSGRLHLGFGPLPDRPAVQRLIHPRAVVNPRSATPCWRRRSC
jgi:ferrous-iron efflux pump FieF